MKILVTGGLGFIGSHTAVELLNSNNEVIIVDGLASDKYFMDKTCVSCICAAII